MEDLLINSIYVATEGEGVLIGSPQAFIRFQGCKLACKNCDSKETWSFQHKNFRSIEETLAKLEDLDAPKRVSITGGDPLDPFHRKGVMKLVGALKNKGFWINIEATGAEVPHDIFDLLDFISIDFKTPSTGVLGNIEVIKQMASQYIDRFQVKSVIENNLDFDYVVKAKNTLEQKIGKINFPWVLTPSFNTGEDFPKERVLEIIKRNENLKENAFRVIVQQHKWLYGSIKRHI